MEFYPANCKKQIKAKISHDPDAKRIFGFFYKPPVWQANKVYRADKNMAIPTVFNGFFYVVKSNGKTDGIEPTWSTEKNEEVKSGTVTFKAVPYNLFLGELEAITNSTWSATESVPLSGDNYTADGTTHVMVGNIPADVYSFTLTNHITKSNGEEDDRSIIITISEK